MSFPSLLRPSLFALLFLLVSSTNGQQQDKQPLKKENVTPDELCLRDMLMYVTHNDSKELIRLLNDTEEHHCLKHINDIIPDGFGQTLLMHAIVNGNSPSIITTLLDYGADVTIGEKDGYTPIHGAGLHGRGDVVKILLEHPKTKTLIVVDDKHVGDGHTPFHRACWGKDKRHTETVKVLLELGANPDEPICTKQLTKEYKANAEPRRRRTKRQKQEEIDAHGEMVCEHILEVLQNKASRNIILEYTKVDKYIQEREELKTKGEL